MTSPVFVIVSIALVVVAVAIVQWIGPLQSTTAARHEPRLRGQTIGVVEHIANDRVITVGYGVDGATYQITQTFDEPDALGERTDDPHVRRLVRDISAGNMYVGGEVTVRYNTDNPAQAIVVPK